MEATECWARFQETGNPRDYLDYCSAREAAEEADS